MLKVFLCLLEGVWDHRFGLSLSSPSSGALGTLPEWTHIFTPVIAISHSRRALSTSQALQLCTERVPLALAPRRSYQAITMAGSLCPCTSTSDRLFAASCWQGKVAPRNFLRSYDMRVCERCVFAREAGNEGMRTTASVRHMTGVSRTGHRLSRHSCQSLSSPVYTEGFESQ